MNADTVRDLLSNATPGPWISPWELPDTAEDAELSRFITANGECVVGFPMEYDPDILWCHRENAALIASAPAVAQWGLERDAEASWLRILLAQALKDYDVGAWRHSTRGGDDYPEPNWVTHARGILGSTS